MAARDFVLIAADWRSLPVFVSLRPSVPIPVAVPDSILSFLEPLDKMFSQTVRRAAAISSPLSPKYYTPRTFHGIDARSAIKYGAITGAFGASAGIGVLFFLGEVPRVRRDILQQFPFFDQYFDRRVAPEDNPF